MVVQSVPDGRIVLTVVTFVYSYPDGSAGHSTRLPSTLPSTVFIVNKPKRGTQVIPPMASAVRLINQQFYVDSGFSKPRCSSTAEVTRCWRHRHVYVALTLAFKQRFERSRDVDCHLGLWSLRSQAKTMILTSASLRLETRILRGY